MNRFFRSLTSFFILFIALTGPAHAKERLTAVSTPEDVALAFYKTAGERPAFDKWIKFNSVYITAPLTRREDVYAQEIDRLSKKWDSLDLEKDYLTVRTAVRARLLDIPEGKKQIEILIPGGKVDYFPYVFMEENFAVLPDELTPHLTPVLSDQEKTFVEQHLGPMSRKFFLTVELKPLKADTSGTQVIDGQPQWLLSARLASLALWSPSGFLLWEYTAPWFVTPVTESLNGLYKNPAGSPAP